MILIHVAVLLAAATPAPGATPSVDINGTIDAMTTLVMRVIGAIFLAVVAFAFMRNYMAYPRRMSPLVTDLILALPCALLVFAPEVIVAIATGFWGAVYR